MSFCTTLIYSNLVESRLISSNVFQCNLIYFVSLTSLQSLNRLTRLAIKRSAYKSMHPSIFSIACILYPKRAVLYIISHKPHGHLPQPDINVFFRVFKLPSLVPGRRGVKLSKTRHPGPAQLAWTPKFPGPLLVLGPLTSKVLLKEGLDSICRTLLK